MSWDQFAASRGSLAAFSSFIALEVSEKGTLLHAGANESMPLAIGSASRLYVLGALARAVEMGAATWGDKLAIRDDWKSRPGRGFQNEPAGAEFTLRESAERMVSASDNTAADHLVLGLGR